MRIVAAILVSVLLAACGGRNLHHAQEGVTANPEPKAPRSDRLQAVWSVRTGGEFDAAQNVIRPAIDEDRVFVAGPEGLVTAVEADSGSVLWRTDLDEALSAGVGTGDGLVLVGTANGDLVALDRRDGAELWRVGLSGESLTPPVVARGVVLVRVGDSRLVGFDSANGAQLWSMQKTVEGLTVRGASKPLLEGRGAVVGLADGRLMAVDIDTGRLLWETPIGQRRGSSEIGRLADIDADPVLLGTVLYVASFQGQVVSMAMGSTQVLWSADISTLRNLGLDEDHLYVTSDTGELVALNRYSGDAVWRNDVLKGRGVSAPLAIRDSVLVGDYEGVIYLFDRNNGTLSARLPLSGGAVVAPPQRFGDTVVVMTESGRAHALRFTD